MQEGDRHWSLLLIKYSMVVMETVIWGGVSFQWCRNSMSWECFLILYLKPALERRYLTLA